MTDRRATDRFGAVPDEAGAALIMAIIVMVVLTSLTLAVLARSVSVMNFIRQGQDYDAALANADSGLADALYKIDQSARPSWQAKYPAGTWTDKPPAGTTMAFRYWAQKNTDSEYVVTAIGYTGKAKHALQARVNRTAQFPYALFSRGPLTLDGTASAGPNKIAFGLYAGTGNVRVGSNATVVCNGGVPPNIIVDWYSAQSECAGAQQINKLETPRDLTIKEPAPPAGTTDPNWENCPNNGVFGALTTTVTTTVVVNGVTSVVNSTVNTSITNPAIVSGTAGPYVCRRNVTFLGTMVPDPAQPEVKIFILPRSNADGSKSYYNLDMSSAVVNPAQSATRFQVYKVGGGSITHNTASDLTFRGVLFAPDTAMTINGGQLQWAGSINVGQLVVNGTPNLKILYDFDLDTYLGPDWRVSRYREIPSPGAMPNWGTLG